MSSAHATALIVIVPIRHPNAAIIIEEVYREYSDKKAPIRHPIFEFSYEVDLQCIICIIQHLIILPVSPPVGNQMSLILVAST
jgi:hypothetical protein